MKTIKLVLTQAFIIILMMGLFSCDGKNPDSANPKINPGMKTSFYTLSATLNNGEKLDFSSLKGKKVLIVNTASKCGFSSQYADLEKLSERYKDKLTIIAFPANDFANQENGSDLEISEFCKVNYGVTFPIAKKAGVVKNPDQQLVFKWLTDKEMNGWNDQAPEWNFSKYLISENGDLLRYFESSVSPLDEQLITLIEK